MRARFASIRQKRIIADSSVVAANGVVKERLIAKGVVCITALILFESESTYGVIVVIIPVVKKRRYPDSIIAGPGGVAVQGTGSNGCVPSAGGKAKRALLPSAVLPLG